MKKETRGRKKGGKNKNPYPRKGENSHLGKLWDVYRHGIFQGTFKTQSQVSKFTGKSAVRCWQIANGYQGSFCHGHPIITKDGWCILKHKEEYGWWL